jgi:hypothetical protein
MQLATKAVANLSSGPYQDNPLTGVFSTPVSFVSLWAGDAGNDIDSWRLDTYDAVVGGNLLGSVSIGQWNGSPYTNAAIAAPGILVRGVLHRTF